MSTTIIASASAACKSLTTAAQPNRVLGAVSLPRQVGLVLLPPGGEAVEQAELVLGDLVEGHLVLVLAALLGECAHALVHPLVAVDLGTSLRLLRMVVAAVVAGVLVRMLGVLRERKTRSASCGSGT